MDFFAAVLVAVVLLVAVVVTGRAGRRRAHLSLVAAALAALAVAVWRAEALGSRYDLESAGWITPVHLAIARATLLSYLLPIAAGLLTLRFPRVRPVHGRFAALALLLTALAAVTEAWMLGTAARLPGGGD
ncbi:MAG: hypothetical protein AB1726_11005 [Planctomycetota bacterium]